MKGEQLKNAAVTAIKPETNRINVEPPGESTQLLDRNNSLITVKSTESKISQVPSSSYIGTYDGNGRTINDSIVSLTSQLSITGVSVESEKEGAWKMLREISIPFLLAGLAMVGAGILLDHFLAKWSVYQVLPSMVILTTPLLGLKGDLEMTLASRLSTQANLGNLDNKKLRNQICFANLCLDQHQANICAVIATLVAVLTKLCNDPHGTVTWQCVLVMCSSSILTSSIVSILLGSIMVLTVISSRKCHTNPDNIASPIAGSLGDVITLTALTFIGQWFFEQKDKPNTSWIAYFVIVFYLGVVTPLCGIVAHRNAYTKHALLQGWFPVIFSVVLSTVGGVFLDLAQNESGEESSGVALYQPLINGIGGNIASVQSSRSATYLHRYCIPGTLPKGESLCFSPHKVFFGKGEDVLSARLLIIISIPGHIIFTGVAHLIARYSRTLGDKNYGLVFLICFLLAELSQVIMLLYISKLLANKSWEKKLDPDTFSIPYLTAFGDLFGSGFLYIAFLIITAIPDKI